MRLIYYASYIYFGRRGGLVVMALDSGSRGPGSSPGRVIVLCSLARHFTLTVPLSTQEYKWVPEKCWGGRGGYLRWTSIPSRRNSNIPSRLKEHNHVFAHAPGFDFWTGCREFKDARSDVEP